MSHGRAFSDTEIITIAAVAASALGGIVVGLGRGQEDSHETTKASDRVRSGVSRAVDTTSARVHELQGRDLPIAREDVQRLYEHARPAARSAVERASSSLEGRADLASAAERAKSTGKRQGSMISDLVRSAAMSVLDAGLSNVSGPDGEKLKQNVASVIERIGKPSSVDGKSDEMTDNAVSDRISEDLGGLQESISAAPELVRDATSKSRAVARRRIARPVSDAASATGDATKETLAALVWLSLGAGIVYFGLLSDERREQVKSAICGSIEQGRLLMLDLQGYEPEM